MMTSLFLRKLELSCIQPFRWRSRIDRLRRFLEDRSNRSMGESRSGATASRQIGSGVEGQSKIWILAAGRSSFCRYGVVGVIKLTRSIGNPGSLASADFVCVT